MVDVQQSVGQTGINKTAAPNISENSQPLDFFLRYIQILIPVIAYETNCYIQQDAQVRNKQDFLTPSK
jgi:hypothetical protein